MKRMYSIETLLASSHHYEELQHFADHGIEVSGDVKVNLEKMIARKQAVVDQTSGGVKFLMDKTTSQFLMELVLLKALLL